MFISAHEYKISTSVFRSGIPAGDVTLHVECPQAEESPDVEARHAARSGVRPRK